MVNPLVRDRAPRFVPGLVAVATVLWLTGADGGAFPVDLGLPAVALLAVLVVVIVASDRLSLGRAELVAVGAWTALLVWTVSSALWSPGVATPLAEAERTALYLAAVAACLFGGERASARPLAAALLVAATTVSCWSLLPRLLHPASANAGVGAGRLAGPLGYWNGLGLVAAIGCLLALGFAVHGERIAVRASASAALVVLAPTLYFTFSRGSWLALAIGLLVATTVEQRRWPLASAVLGAVPAAALALVAAAHARALGQTGLSSGAAGHEGHVLAGELVVLGVLAAGLAAAAARLPQPRPLPGRLRAPLRMTAAAVAVLALVAIVAVGKPVTRANHLLASFRAEPAGASSDLGGRLFSTSGNGRSAYWSVAWREARAHPLLGGGAGSYERSWLRWRPVPAPALDAHELYLETLAELGPVGAAALLLALLAPFASLRRARREPLTAACAGAYAAFLVHAALDWDWELTAVGLVGLLCGVSLLLAGRAAGQGRRLGWRGASAILAPAVALGGLIFVLHVGNSASAASEAAAGRDDNRAATRAARRAVRWAPWSAQAHRDLGEALLAEGDTGTAAVALRQGIAEDDSDWQLWYDLALTRSGRGRNAALARAAALDPLGPDIAQAAAAENR